MNIIKYALLGLIFVTSLTNAVTNVIYTRILTSLDAVTNFCGDYYVSCRRVENLHGTTYLVNYTLISAQETLPGRKQDPIDIEP